VSRIASAALAAALAAGAVGGAIPPTAARASTPAASSAATPATAPAGRVAISLLDVPVSERNDPRARVYIIDQVRPGAHIVRRVRIANQSNAAQSVSAYAGPASIQHGSIAFGNAGANNDLTSWTSVGPSTLPVPPGHSADATVRINVPKNASNGERYAVIWAQVKSTVAAGQTTEVNRVGVRVYLDVYGGSAVQRSSFTITGLSGSRSVGSLLPVVTAHVHNTGQRALDLTGALRLNDGPSGLSAGPFNTQQPTSIAPGGTAAVVFTLGRQLPDGPWLAKLNLASGETKGHAAATITFPSRAGQVAKATPTHGSSFPWLLVVIAAVLVGLLGLVWFLWRRRRQDEDEEGTPPRELASAR
jgi:hypothetical protein